MEAPHYHPAERPPMTCTMCGAGVTDPETHNRWHAAQSEAAVHIVEAGQFLAVA